MAAHAEHHARLVKRFADARQLRDIGLGLVRDAYAGRDPADVLAEGRADLEDLGRDGSTHAIKSARVLLAECPDLDPPVIHGIARQGETVNIIRTGPSGAALPTEGRGNSRAYR